MLLPVQKEFGSFEDTCRAFFDTITFFLRNCINISSSKRSINHRVKCFCQMLFNTIRNFFPNTNLLIKISFQVQYITALQQFIRMLRLYFSIITRLCQNNRISLDLLRILWFTHRFIRFCLIQVFKIKFQIRIIFSENSNFLI
jgi:hypothetical protein